MQSPSLCRCPPEPSRVHRQGTPTIVVRVSVANPSSPTFGQCATPAWQSWAVGGGTATRGGISPTPFAGWSSATGRALVAGYRPVSGHRSPVAGRSLVTGRSPIECKMNSDIMQNEFRYNAK
ncbi:hypothetical protein TIFTF001_008743 [Ficus carica]|uniref:Uncharacterized protein n=1 Tax=Ficus carica TaxID=3494 RepID=A0AA87ZSR7_FICCA|nr:hypothetical protein TIFTF001_008743 [Ficus carica]